MRKLLVMGSLAILALGGAGQAQAFEDSPFFGPANGSDGVYWPAYRTPEWAGREGCVRWNWQELSYYNYCASEPYRRRAKAVLRVRG